ncbi:transposable element Tcb1 transposase [Trichonephila clavipes]|nr:transposable element Tcb1 transposase [Trichonephila clavipes]
MKQATRMQICHRRKKRQTDGDRSYLPRCTTARDDRLFRPEWNVRKAPIASLTLAGTHRSLRYYWCNGRWTWKMQWNDIVFTDEFHFRLQHHDVPIAGTLNRQRYISEELEPVVLPYIQRLPSALFQKDNALPHPIENVWSKLAQWLTWDTPPVDALDELRQYVEAI